MTHEELERAVISAALAWHRSCGLYGMADRTGPLGQLADAIDALTEAPLPWEQPTNKPTGFVLRKAWKAIPAGWFVQAKPGGPWYEVLETIRRPGAQAVMLRIGNDSKTYPRDPDAPVTCRRGTLTGPVSDALDALSDGVEILEDGT